MNTKHSEGSDDSRKVEFGCCAITLQQLKETAIVNLKSEIAQEPILKGVTCLKGLSDDDKHTVFSRDWQR